MASCLVHRTAMRRHCHHKQCYWLSCRERGCVEVYDVETLHWRGEDWGAQ